MQHKGKLTPYIQPIQTIYSIFVPLSDEFYRYAQCSSCIHDCDWQCEHKGRCPLVCGAPCVRIPCNKVSENAMSMND